MAPVTLAFPYLFPSVLSLLSCRCRDRCLRASAAICDTIPVSLRHVVAVLSLQGSLSPSLCCYLRYLTCFPQTCRCPVAAGTAVSEPPLLSAVPYLFPSDLSLSCRCRDRCLRASAAICGTLPVSLRLVVAVLSLQGSLSSSLRRYLRYLTCFPQTCRCCPVAAGIAVFQPPLLSAIPYLFPSDLSLSCRCRDRCLRASAAICDIDTIPVSRRLVAVLSLQGSLSPSLRCYLRYLTCFPQTCRCPVAAGITVSEPPPLFAVPYLFPSDLSLLSCRCRDRCLPASAAICDTLPVSLRLVAVLSLQGPLSPSLRGYLRYLTCFPHTCRRCLVAAGTAVSETPRYLRYLTCFPHTCRRCLVAAWIAVSEPPLLSAVPYLFPSDLSLLSCRCRDRCLPASAAICDTLPVSLRLVAVLSLQGSLSPSLRCYLRYLTCFPQTCRCPVAAGITVSEPPLLSAIPYLFPSHLSSLSCRCRDRCLPASAAIWGTLPVSLTLVVAVLSLHGSLSPSLGRYMRYLTCFPQTCRCPVAAGTAVSEPRPLYAIPYLFPSDLSLSCRFRDRCLLAFAAICDTLPVSLRFVVAVLSLQGPLSPSLCCYLRYLVSYKSTQLIQKYTQLIYCFEFTVGHFMRRVSEL